VGFLRSVREIIRNKNVLFLLLALFSWFIGFSGIEALFTLYGEKYIGIKTSAATLSFAFISAAFLLFAVPAGILGTKIGKKNTIALGVGGMVPCFFTIIFLRKIVYIRAVFIICGFCWALININAYPLVIDMAPKDKQVPSLVYTILLPQWQQ